MHKKIVITLVLALSALMVNAQNWQTDFEEAKALANSKNLEILMIFEGSDWCAPCIRLEKEILSTEEFIKYAEDHYVLLKVDFPRKKAHALPTDQQEKNNKLAEQYNSQGYFPMVILMDKNGNIKGRTSYVNISPDEYIHLLTSFNNLN